MFLKLHLKDKYLCWKIAAFEVRNWKCQRKIFLKNNFLLKCTKTFFLFLYEKYRLYVAQKFKTDVMIYWFIWCTTTTVLFSIFNSFLCAFNNKCQKTIIYDSLDRLFPLSTFDSVWIKRHIKNDSICQGSIEPTHYRLICISNLSITFILPSHLWGKIFS